MTRDELRDRFSDEGPLEAVHCRLCGREGADLICEACEQEVDGVERVPAAMRHRYAGASDA